MAIFRRSDDLPQHLARPGVAAPPAAPAMEPTRAPLTRADIARLDRIREGLAAFGADTSTPAALERLLDRSSAEWVAIPTKRRPDPLASINNFGVGLGDHLCEQLGGHWIMYADDQGTEFAVEIGDGGPLLFPIATVASWWGRHSGWVMQYMAESARVATGQPEPTPQPPAPAAVPDAGQAAPASPQVNALAKRALDRAVAALQAGDGRFMPFALVEDALGMVEVTQFAGDPAEGQELARRQARTSPASRAAVAWEGVITQSGEIFPAVLVEASDRGVSSLLVAQRHQNGQVAGPPMLMGRQAPLL